MLSTRVTHLDVDFAKVSLMVFILVFRVFEQSKICHGVRVYSRNLFRYPNVPFGPGCVAACIAAGRYTVTMHL